MRSEAEQGVDRRPLVDIEDFVDEPAEPVVDDYPDVYGHEEDEPEPDT